jgi:hypothetical protein
MNRVRWLCLLLLLACPALAQQASETRIDLIWLGDLGNTQPPTPPAGKVVLFVANGRLCQKDSSGATNCFAFGAGASGGGTVTSVGLSAPPQFTVTGSPVTTFGTISIGWNTQTANTVLAGPASGQPGAPSFRALTGADIPPINLASTGNGGVTGILPVSGGGTGTSTPSLAAGSNITVSGPWPNQTVSVVGSPSFTSVSTGSLTSTGTIRTTNGAYHDACAGFCAGFGFDTPTSTTWLFRVHTADAWLFSVPDLSQPNALVRVFGGTQIGVNPTLQVNGNLTVTDALSLLTPLETRFGGTGVSSASPNTVLAGPVQGAAAAPSFRQLTAADLPAPGGDVGGTYGSMLVMSVHFGTTSVPFSATAPASGQCLAYNGTVITGTPCGGSGSGTVTSVGLAAPSQFTVTGSPVTTAGTITLAWAAQNPATFLAGPVSAPAAAPTFRSIAASDLPAPGGDVAGPYGSMSVTALHFGTTGIPLSTTAPTSGQCLGYTGTAIAGVACGGGGGGTVTSVAFAAPSQFTVSGSPITTSGTITLGWASQNANTVLAGPSSGPAAAPAFRALVAADIPAGNSCAAGQYATGLGAALTLSCAQVAYSQISGTPTLYYQTVQAGGTAQTQRPVLNLVSGSNASVSCADDATNNRTSCTVSAVGTVTSVGLAAPAQFTVTGSPVTGSGTLTLGWASQNANTVLAGPTSGAAASPSFRSLVAADIPAGNSCPSGQYATALGAALTLTCAQVAYSQVSGTPTLYYQTVQSNGTAQTQRPALNLVSGSNASVSCADDATNNRTSCTVSAVGTVTSVGLSAPSQFTVTGSPVTDSGTLTLAWASQTANTVLAGPSSGPAAAPTFRALVAADMPAPGGNVGGTYASMTVTGLNFGSTSIPLSTTAPATNQCLGYNGTSIVGMTCTGTVTGAVVVYNTPSASTGFGTNIAATTMATAGSTGNTYLVTLGVYQVTVGSGCNSSKTSSATASITFTDARSNTSITLSSPTLTVTGNGSVGQNVQASFTANVAASASLSYSVSSTTSAGCTTVPNYYVVPSVIQVK